MGKPHETTHSRLLTLRVWTEEIGNGQQEWRVQVKDVSNGETHYFHEFTKLSGFLQEVISKSFNQPDPGSQ
jgi:hypothetical protein